YDAKITAARSDKLLTKRFFFNPLDPLLEWIFPTPDEEPPEGEVEIPSNPPPLCRDDVFNGPLPILDG
ncbi:13178_t:CDS:1, partial [Cetraspora pellucida]